MLPKMLNQRYDYCSFATRFVQNCPIRNGRRGFDVSWYNPLLVCCFWNNHSPVLCALRLCSLCYGKSRLALYVVVPPSGKLPTPPRPICLPSPTFFCSPLVIASDSWVKSMLTLAWRPAVISAECWVWRWKAPVWARASAKLCNL